MFGTRCPIQKQKCLSASKVLRAERTPGGTKRGRGSWLLQDLPGHSGSRTWQYPCGVIGGYGGLGHCRGDPARLTGDILGETILGSLTPRETHELLRLPTGCPEQTLSSLTPVIILTRYLDTTGQWGKVGVEHRDQVMKNIVSGECHSPGTSTRVSGAPPVFEEAPMGRSQTITPEL